MNRLAAAWFAVAALCLLSIPAAPAAAASDDNPLKFSADGRFREEYATSVNDGPERNRLRVRLRLAASYWANSELEVGARLSTGSASDPNAPYLNLGNGLERAQFNLDRAFATYRPGWAKGTNLTFGKFGHPFWSTPVFGEIVWDADVQPEGISLGYSAPPGFLDKFKLAGGWYVLQEQASLKDAGVFVAQGSGGGKLGEKVHVDAGLGYYGYTNLTPDGSQFLINKNRGNAIDTTGTDTFVSEFSILDVGGSIGLNPSSNRKYAVTGQYTKNLDANIEADKAWALGGQATISQWYLFYQYQRVEQDAVMSIFAQDDFLRSTAFRGHVFGTKYTVSRTVSMRLWALSTEALTGADSMPAGESAWRFRFEVDLTH